MDVEQFDYLYNRFICIDNFVLRFVFNDIIADRRNTKAVMRKPFPLLPVQCKPKRETKKKKRSVKHVVVTGCVLHYMLVGKEPFDCSEQMLKQQVSGDIVLLRPTFGHTISASAKQLIRLILEPDVLKRARIGVIKRSQWMTTTRLTGEDRHRPPLGIAPQSCPRVTTIRGDFRGSVKGLERSTFDSPPPPLMSVHCVITVGRFQNSHIPTRYNCRRNR